MQTYRQHISSFGLYSCVCLYLCLLSCREAESPPDALAPGKTFAEFFIRYLAPEEQLLGQVSFWKGVSWEVRDPLEPSGLVSFENQELEPRRLPGNQVRYSGTLKKAYKDSLAFRFRNQDGRYLQYEMKMTPIRDFFVKGRVSKTEGATFVVNGGIINQEEEIVFMFIDQRNRAKSITIKGPTTDIGISIPAEKLQELTPGPGQLYLVKKQHRSESHPNLDLTASLEYYTGQREVLVEE